MPPKIITTARLRLEAAEPRHLDSRWKAIESSLSELRKWMDWAIHESRDSSREFLERAVKAWDAGTQWTFAITLEGEVVGTVSIDNYQALTASAELGYWVSTAHTGQGFATEAGAVVVNLAFKELGLHRLQLHAGTDNIASQRVAEKLGFKRLGRARDFGRGDEGFFDCYAYDLLVNDPRPLGLDG
jgi:ribosomal-protein-serine acetyltransferase